MDLMGPVGQDDRGVGADDGVLGLRKTVGSAPGCEAGAVQLPLMPTTLERGMTGETRRASSRGTTSPVASGRV